MAATAGEISRLRYLFDLDEAAYPDAAINELFDELELVYAGSARTVIIAAAQYEIAQMLWIRASKRVSYTRGPARESLSDMAKALEKVARLKKVELEEQIGMDELPAVRWGRTLTVPTVLVEYPDNVEL